MQLVRSFFAPLCVVTLFLGCGGPSNPKTYKVTGVVTLDGQAVEAANVSFVPREAKSGLSAAAGTTDASGKYELTSFVANDGVMEGDFDIKVAKYVSKDGKVQEAPEADAKQPDGSQGMEGYSINPNTPVQVFKNVLPPKYENENTSELKFTVKSPGGTFDIPLKKK